MPIQYDIDSKGIIQGRPYGILSTAEVIEYLQAVMTDQRRKDPYREIFLLEKVEELRLDTAAMREIVNFAKEHILVLEGGKVAYVAEGDFEFGMGRVLEAYAAGLPLELHAFRTLEEAQAWIDSE